MRTTLSRYIPEDAIERRDPESDGIAYLYERQGTPCAIAYRGKAVKPNFRFRFKTEANRNETIEAFFKRRRQVLANRKAHQAERATFQHGYKVGDIFNTCWGYDQTNIEFFEVVAVKGKMLTLREIAKASETTGFDTGTCMPQSGAFIGEPIRRLAGRYGVKIDNVRRAGKWNTEEVMGIKLGQPLRWSSYA